MQLPLNTSVESSVQLAIETTGRTGSLAILSADKVLQQVVLEPSVRTAAALAPQIERLMQWSRQQGRPVDFISVADGPGSFTGLRIGVTTAKTICYALSIPLVSVDSLAAIAATVLSAPGERSNQTVLVAIDAFRQQVFAAQFTADELLPPLDAIPQSWTSHPPQIEVLDQPQWQTWLTEAASTSGPAIGYAGDRKLFPPQISPWLQRDCDAVGVGRLGVRAAAAGHWTDPMQLVPRYLKASAAEEKAGV